MSSQSKVIGHLACLSAYIIFGFNIIACKNVANTGLVSPMTILSFRSIGAALLFWLTSLFMPKERVPFHDLFKIFLASLLGLFLTQIFFLEAISRTTPLDSAILTSTTPIFTMFVAAVALKEPITLKKAGGVAISFVGVLILIMNSVHSSCVVTQSKPLGLFFMIMNCLCFALYLGIFKPLIQRYSVITFMKWMFLFSMLMSVAFDAKEIFTLDYSALPSNTLLQLAYIVVFATFLAYFFVPVGQKVLRPTIISLYSYVQPIIATISSIVLGMDALTWQKLVAAAMVFGGVTLVNMSRSAAQTSKHKRCKSLGSR